jgi:4-amino-4-deoxy-L-arabinose transferase-like glycosyltransferase
MLTRARHLIRLSGPGNDHAARDLAILVPLVGLLLVAGLGRSALTDRDEGANAAAAREMLETGAWVTPTLNYQPRFAKPALVYWLMGGAYRLLGAGETAARLPSALASTALVFIQYAFARWALGGAAGLRAALVLLTSLLFVAVGRMALADATLVLWTTATGFAFFRAATGSPPRRRWYALAWVALGLAMLTKGPVGVIVPVAGIVTHLALAGGGRAVLREVGLAWGPLLFLGVAGPWYAAMLLTHGASYMASAQDETLGRVLRTVTGPGGTALFYVPVLLVGMFPWSAYLPGALVTVLRGARSRAASGRAGAALVFAASGVVSGFVLFSLLRSRLPHYVAPLVPAAALLVAATFPGPRPRVARALLVTLGVLIGLVAVGGRLAGLSAGRLLAGTYPAAAEATLPGAAIAAGLLALAVAALAAWRPASPPLAVLAVLTILFLTVGIHAVAPAFSDEFVLPAGALAHEAATATSPCDEIVAFGPYRPSLLFYARRRLTFVDLPDRWRLAEVAAHPGRLHVITPRSQLPLLEGPPGPPPSVSTRGGYALVRSAVALPGCSAPAAP